MNDRVSDTANQRTVDGDEGTLAAAMSNWETILEELSVIANEYEARDWETLTIRPGEIQLLSGDPHGPRGLHILIPDDEYRAVESLFEAGVSLDEYDVYKTLIDGVVYLVVVVEDADSQTALLYPVYYSLGNADAITDVQQGGQFQTRLRRLNGEYVELTHEDPSLLAPPAE